MIRLPSIFITGTDTGVGKTVITALLALLYQEAGVRIGLEKPVITGVKAGEDAALAGDLALLRRVLSTGEGPVYSYAFTPAVSPHLAAARAGVTIDLARIESDHAAVCSRYDAVLVEGAGGLLVPLNDDSFMADLAARLKLPLVIVSRPSLGTINHTLLTVSFARKRGLEVVGVVINNYPARPGLAETDNPGAIEKFARVPVLAIVPHITGLSVEEAEEGDIQRVAQAVDKKFKLLERLSRWREEHVQ
ncbi:MAG: dethiobiotin synthase [Thermodesulfobacteriota bacterium]|nr:dethiobiotin synthase [Thermodesulfobacteriota bacterium]